MKADMLSYGGRKHLEGAKVNQNARKRKTAERSMKWYIPETQS
jgi:hypothetical protein